MRLTIAEKTNMKRIYVLEHTHMARVEWLNRRNLRGRNKKNNNSHKTHTKSESIAAEEAA